MDSSAAVGEPIIGGRRSRSFSTRARLCQFCFLIFASSPCRNDHMQQNLGGQPRPLEHGVEAALISARGALEQRRFLSSNAYIETKWPECFPGQAMGPRLGVSPAERP